MPTLLDDDLAAYTGTAYRQKVGQLRTRQISAAKAQWKALPAYRTENINGLLDRLIPQVKAGQQQIAQLTDTYLSYVTGNDPAGVLPLDELGREGIDLYDVYQRPANTVYTKLAEGKTLTEAVASGMARLVSLIATDMQLAKTRQSGYTLPKLVGVSGFRRVPQGRASCALCLIASTMLYRKKDLLPIHPGCGCNVEPVKNITDYSFGTGGHTTLDPELLESLHAQIEGQTGLTVDRSGRDVDYRKLMVVREHGELGPVLTWKDKLFTDASQIPARRVDQSPGLKDLLTKLHFSAAQQRARSTPVVVDDGAPNLMTELRAAAAGAKTSKNK
jgi:hypothetical protein